MDDYLYSTWMPDSMRLGWALIHFLWQGIIIALLLELALGLAGRKNASLRYVLCGLALASMPVCLVDTYLTLGRETYSVVPHTVSAEIAAVGASSLRGAPAAVHAMGGLASLEMPSFDLNQWLPGIVAVWLGGVVILAGRKAGALVVLWRLRRRGLYVPSDAMCELCRNACEKIGVDPRRVYLGISSLVQVPMTMGCIRPVILFPAALLSGLSTSEIELLMAHELAHIRRCDYLVNLIQTAVETLFFYHPVTWWMSRRMRQERENCCDDLVAARSTEVVAYATVLYRLAALSLSSEESLVTAASGGSLVQRIRRLADEPAPSSSWGLPLLLTFLAVLGMVTAGSMIKAHAIALGAHSVIGARSRANDAASAVTVFSTPDLSSTRLTVMYQDKFGRKGDLDGSGPSAVNAGCTTWTSSTGLNQYTTSGASAAMSPTAYSFSLAYLPVNGTSRVTLDGTKDFTLSVVVTPGATGRTGISLNTGKLERYSNLFSQDFAALTTSPGFAGAYAFNDGNIDYNYGPGIKGPTTVSIAYSAADGILTYTVGHTVVHIQKGVTPDQVAAIRYVAMGNDGYGGGDASSAPNFSDFTFTEGASILSSSSRLATNE